MLCLNTCVYLHLSTWCSDLNTLCTHRLLSFYGVSDAAGAPFPAAAPRLVGLPLEAETLRVHQILMAHIA